MADDKLLDEAGALAAELAQGPHSLKLIRNLLWESIDAKYEEQLNNERQAQRTAGRTEDFKEAKFTVTAFKKTEKRDAKRKFTGNSQSLHFDDERSSASSPSFCMTSLLTACGLAIAARGLILFEEGIT